MMKDVQDLSKYLMQVFLKLGITYFKINCE